MNSEYNGFEVAIIGMSARYPKSRDINEYWQNLLDGRECITFFTYDELLHAGLEKEILESPDYVKANGILEDYEYFDAPFFDYNSKEAEIMDPQKRIFMELLWHALEDAGYDPFKYDKAIGLYAGFGRTFDWEAKKLIAGISSIDHFVAQQLMSGDFTPTQASYKLNLRGPSYSLYSACSTSLVAVHNAVQALISGECDMAIAGGITVTSNQIRGYTYNPEMIFSSDGHCRPFDTDSSGIVSGNGGGVVVLKLLESAIKDNDYIYAVIKGSSVNNDGNRKVGYTAPSVDGQVEVIRNALQIADVSPESISYIEAHGTATRLGDPIEIQALKKAFYTDRKNYCAIGSVKSNIGHCDTGAGIAGFIKTVLCLKNRMLVPSINYSSPNPSLGIEDSPFYVNTECKDLVNDNRVIRAGVSSLGIGGTNAHIVLEEYKGIGKYYSDKKERLIVMSAKTKNSLEEKFRTYSDFFSKHNCIDLDKAAFTLQSGRAEFDHRAAFCAKNNGEIVKILKNGLSDANIKHNHLRTKKISVVFMFSGQGAQYCGMGKGLYESEPVFRENIDECIRIIGSVLKTDIKNILYPSTPEEFNEAEKKINEMIYSGPVKFSFEYAMSKLLVHYGIEPDILIGHSFGEYVAATLCGVFRLEDALKLSVIRGRLMHKSEEGAMMSIPLSEDEIRVLLNDKISLAAVNTQSLCIVSGKKTDLENLSEELQKKDIECLMLNVPRAGHSYMMDGILDEFEKGLEGIVFNKPERKYFSGTLGTEAFENDICNQEYWKNHIRQTVNFSDSISAIFRSHKNALLIEVSPGKGLSLFAETNEDKKAGHIISGVVRHHKENLSDERYFLEKLGYLWVSGADISWNNFYEEIPGKIPLPGYSFDKYLFRSESSFESELAKAGKNNIDPRKSGESGLRYFYPSWKRGIRISENYEENNKNLYIIFGGDQDNAKGIMDELSNRKLSYIEVRNGDSFKKISDNLFETDFSSERDLSGLLEEIKREHDNKSPHILWTLDRYSIPDLSGEFLKKTLVYNVKLTIVMYNSEDIVSSSFSEETSEHIIKLKKVVGDAGKSIIKLVSVQKQKAQESITVSGILNISEDKNFNTILYAISGNFTWKSCFDEITTISDDEAIFSFQNIVLSGFPENTVSVLADTIVSRTGINSVYAIGDKASGNVSGNGDKIELSGKTLVLQVYSDDLQDNLSDAYYEGFYENNEKISRAAWKLSNDSGYPGASDIIKQLKRISALSDEGFSEIIISDRDPNENFSSVDGTDRVEVPLSERDLSGQTYLPRPANITEDHVPPSTEKEKTITDIFVLFFGYDTIGVNDNFFELGGDSMKAMKLSNLILKQTGIRISVAKFLKYPTVRLLASQINEVYEEKDPEPQEQKTHQIKRSKVRI